MITIEFDYPAPPLRSNDKTSRWARARIVKAIRRDVAWSTRIQHPGVRIDGPVLVTLVWTVTDRRRRDAGASSPTLKAALDGIVDAGLLPGDHHDIVAEERTRIEIGTQAGVRVEIEPVDTSGDVDSRPPDRLGRDNGARDGSPDAGNRSDEMRGSE